GRIEPLGAAPRGHAAEGFERGVVEPELLGVLSGFAPGDAGFVLSFDVAPGGVPPPEPDALVLHDEDVHAVFGGVFGGWTVLLQQRPDHGGRVIGPTLLRPEPEVQELSERLHVMVSPTSCGSTRARRSAPLVSLSGRLCRHLRASKVEVS